jgi:hypothetical protein
LPDLDEPFLFSDNEIEVKVEIGNTVYWPVNARKDCSNGSTLNNACSIPDDDVTDGSCYPLTNSRAIDIVTPALQITIRDEDIFFDEVIQFSIDTTSEWYFQSTLCFKIEAEATDPATGSIVKFSIEA